MSIKNIALPIAMTAGAAALGALGTQVDSGWYRRLRKPTWQPPGWVFGPAWTTLYSLTAIASTRVLNRVPTTGERRAYVAELGANMAINVAWSWLFFSARRPKASLIDSAILEVSTLRLLQRARRVDAASAALLAPYALWVGFATALNGEVLRLNGHDIHRIPVADLKIND